MKNDSNKIVLITGGARSGKSSYAQQLAMASGKRVLFCATAEALDDEMRIRIEAHKKSRPAGWDTLEASHNVAMKLQEICSGYDTVIIDCITVLTANCMGDDRSSLTAEEKAFAEITALIALMRKKDTGYILVTNEVGYGIVPENPLARSYRDILGKANQQLAKCADEVYLLTAGLPLKIK